MGAQYSSIYVAWLEVLYKAHGGLEVDANYQCSPRNAKWKFVSKMFRIILYLGISRSSLVMDMAHSEHSSGPANMAAFRARMHVYRS